MSEISDEELFGPSANGAGAEMDSSPAASMTPQQAGAEQDDDEDVPEPEGHALTREQSDFMEGDDFFRGPLPHDIAAIWGHPPMRRSDEATARILLGAWGLDTFRQSAVHQAALQAAARNAVTAPSRSAFKAEREKAKKR